MDSMEIIDFASLGKENNVNKKAFRKRNVKQLISDLRCIDVATNLLNLNMERARSNQRYLKPVEHSSMVFDLKTNRVYWNAQMGGQSLDVVGFYSYYKNISKYDAINELYDFFYGEEYNHDNEDIYIYDESLDETYLQKEFSLPFANSNSYQVIDYLTKERCLDRDLIESLVQNHMIYEDYLHNAVFVGYDCKDTDNEKPVFGCRRSTEGEKFQKDVYGSNKRNGIFYKCPVPTDTLVVTEAVIDGLSYATLTKDKPDAHILAASGCGSALTTLKYNLFYNEDLKDIKNIHLMLDLDDAGRVAANNIIEAYKNKSLFKISENEFIEEKELNIRSVKFFLKRHENIKINDLNQMLQIKTKYFDVNDRKREIANEHPGLYYDPLNQENTTLEENENVETEENTHDMY